MNDFEALIFDCDGVLVNSEEIVQDIELALLAEHGLIYDRDEFTRRFLGTSDEHFFAALSADSEAQLGQPLPDSFPAALKSRARQAFSERLRAFDGIEALINSWQHRVAVASSSTINALSYKLEITDLLRFFDNHVYSAEHVSAGKPDPAIYQHTAGQLDVDPDRCIVIEDSVNGVIAARAAGMYTIGFTAGAHCLNQHDEELIAAGAHHVADSMRAVQQHLSKTS